MQEDGPTVCEQCGGQLRRMLYPTGIIFKGSGFYRTDSRNGGASSSSPSKSDTPPKPGAKSTSDSADSSTPTSSEGAKEKSERPKEKKD